MHFIDRRILLITGKGGVGKTTLTVALARAAARRGRRVLLCEIGDPEGGPSPVGRLIGRTRLTDEPVRVDDNLDACHLWARTGHELFLRSVLPGGPLIRGALRSKAVDRFLTAAPSFYEMGVFHHVLTLLEAKGPGGRLRHDLLVLDMPATGHALALTGLPEILLRLIPVGPMADAVRRGQAILNDPEQGEAWVVSLPEQLPVTESIELVAGLRKTGMPTGGILLNRMPIDRFAPDERAAVDGWLTGRHMHGELGFRRIERAEVEHRRLEASVDLPVLLVPDSGDDDPIAVSSAALDAHMEAP